MLDVVALGELLIDFAPVSTDAPGGDASKIHVQTRRGVVQ